MIPFDFDLPTTDGNTARGASSPENPHLHIPDPLSTTSA
eukprot:CAMPEP_0117431606 /NCGR_PEP_ID=MMETSP0758-20121206/11126_1 /TAXON_ID=63605 /ORGANISM="Percolomonas cosmopolitus, Strain AE-1 (ATCC 50343)" /LENGTH=38 /DNA_ID= /DNA_START= /DNA_END= /DNA_ORIENTATION=